MCAACVPTPGDIVDVLPCASFGGADWPPLPWQLSHAAVDTTSTLPSMWSSGYEILPRGEVAGVHRRVHRPQSVFCGCGAGGGLPWQLPHLLWVPSTSVHSGFVVVPPAPGAPCSCSDRSGGACHRGSSCSCTSRCRGPTRRRPPCRRAGPRRVSAPSMWPGEPTSCGHRVARRALTRLCHSEPSRCARWAPTPTAVVSSGRWCRAVVRLAARAVDTAEQAVELAPWGSARHRCPDLARTEIARRDGARETSHLDHPRASSKRGATDRGESRAVASAGSGLSTSGAIRVGAAAARAVTSTRRVRRCRSIDDAVTLVPTCVSTSSSHSRPTRHLASAPAWAALVVALRSTRARPSSRARVAAGAFAERLAHGVELDLAATRPQAPARRGAARSCRARGSHAPPSGVARVADADEAQPRDRPAIEDLHVESADRASGTRPRAASAIWTPTLGRRCTRRPPIARTARWRARRWRRRAPVLRTREQVDVVLDDPIADGSGLVNVLRAAICSTSVLTWFAIAVSRMPGRPASTPTLPLVRRPPSRATRAARSDSVEARRPAVAARRRETRDICCSAGTLQRTPRRARGRRAASATRTRPRRRR